MTMLPPFLVSTAWSVNSLTNERVLRVSEFGGILVALKMGQRSCCRGGRVVVGNRRAIKTTGAKWAATLEHSSLKDVK